LLGGSAFQLIEPFLRVELVFERIADFKLVEIISSGFLKLSV
jgi:hypothetical protein